MIETEFERWCREDADRPGSTPPPGPADRLTLMTLQGSWWCDKDDHWHRVEAMEPSHRRRLLDQLRKRATAWFCQWVDETNRRDPQDGLLAATSGWATPRQWIEMLPLVRALAGFDDRVEAPLAPVTP